MFKLIKRNSQISKIKCEEKKQKVIFLKGKKQQNTRNCTLCLSNANIISKSKINKPTKIKKKFFFFYSIANNKTEMNL